MQKLINDGNEDKEILRQMREYQIEIDIMQEDLDQSTEMMMQNIDLFIEMDNQFP
jgi:hypothetical protein